MRPAKSFTLPDVEDLAVRGLVREERVLGEDDAEARRP